MVQQGSEFLHWLMPEVFANQSGDGADGRLLDI
jgi:hypothetical protein